MTQPAVTLFRDKLGAEPDLAASAPGRVNIIGEHTDYNGGPVLPIAISRRTVVAAGHAAGWRVVSATDGAVVELDVDGALRRDWTDYVVGVVRELRTIGAAPAGALLAVSSTVPIGAGLSSSAALTVAVAAALGALSRRRLPRRVLAAVAYRAEHDVVGVLCGRMDQTISALGQSGQALLFETAEEEISPVPMPGRIGVIETGVVHRLTGGSLNQRRRECEGALAALRVRWPDLTSLAALPESALREAETMLSPVERRRVRHVVTETRRTHAAAEALGAGNLSHVGRLLVEAHDSLRRNYESTIPEADYIVERAVTHGAYGARLTGAGWGGAVLVLAPAEHEPHTMRAIARDFHSRFGRRPAVWHTRASSGVRREALR